MVKRLSAVCVTLLIAYFLRDSIPIMTIFIVTAGIGIFFRRLRLLPIWLIILSLLTVVGSLLIPSIIPGNLMWPAMSLILILLISQSVFFLIERDGQR